MKKGITAHCVVRNEERWIWFSIKSVIDFVDRVLIFDTGSKDNTIKIIRNLKNEYKDKIYIKEFTNVSDEEFYKIRQEQIEMTETEWFLVLDGDEIWYKNSIKELLEITNNYSCDMIATRFYNCVGDIYHLKNYNAEHYRIKNQIGSITIRAYSKRINGICCRDKYGTEGFFDSNNKPVQDNSEKIVVQKGYFLHLSYTQRSSSIFRDGQIKYRRKKIYSNYDYIAGKDFVYPEVFYLIRPSYIYNPFTKSGLLRQFMFFLLNVKSKYYINNKTTK